MKPILLSTPRHEQHELTVHHLQVFRDPAPQARGKASQSPAAGQPATRKTQWFTSRRIQFCHDQGVTLKPARAISNEEMNCQRDSANGWEAGAHIHASPRQGAVCLPLLSPSHPSSSRKKIPAHFSNTCRHSLKISTEKHSQQKRFPQS